MNVIGWLLLVALGAFGLLVVLDTPRAMEEWGLVSLLWAVVLLALTAAAMVWVWGSL